MVSSSPDPEQELAQRQFHDYKRFLNASTLAACVVAPLLIALPPRKLDLLTFSLAGALIGSMDYQAKERTGLGIMSHASRRFTSQDRALVRAVEESLTSKMPSSLLEEPAPRSVHLDGRSIMQQKVQEDWKQQRLKEEQEKLDQGEGYWDMIVDQVWSVWNQGEKKMEEVKEKDQEVLRGRKDKG